MLIAMQTSFHWQAILQWIWNADAEHGFFSLNISLKDFLWYVTLIHVHYMWNQSEEMVDFCTPFGQVLYFLANVLHILTF